VVLTHAHLDHAGLVPMLYKYGYDGPIYCTPPTRDLFVLLQLDYIEVTGREGRKLPYDSNLIRQALKHTITLNYGDVTDIALTLNSRCTTPVTSWDHPLRIST